MARLSTGEGIVVVDIGGTTVKLSHLENGDAGAVHACFATDHLRHEDPVTVLVDFVRKYADEHRLRLETLVLGIPGTLDTALEVPLTVPNVLPLQGVELKRLLGVQLDCRVALERDANLLLLGEWYAGSALGTRSSLGVFFGTGVGVSFLQDGTPFRGATGAALELGHIPIHHEGLTCVCGSQDCLEAYASGRTLHALAETKNIPIARLFVEGLAQPEFREILIRIVTDQARATATAIQLFDPDTAVVGGGVLGMQDFPWQLFCSVVKRHLRHPYPATSVQLRRATLGVTAAVYGARALLGLRAVTKNLV